MNAISKQEAGLTAPTMNETEVIKVLQSSLYPGASAASIQMVLGYCRAAGLDPIQKPVHIVPMWDAKNKTMRDVVMPGIGLYRTQAARSGCAGVSEPEFGDDVTEKIGGVEITYPKWCRVTVKRRLETGEIVDFTAREFWKENYAVRGGQEKSVAPNAMWAKRPYGQIAKCAEAQALRRAFPEVGSEATADEMEGKVINADAIDMDTGEVSAKANVATPQRKTDTTQAAAEVKTEGKEQAKSRAQEADITDVEPRQVNDLLASVGEIAYLTKKLEAKGISISEGRELAGLSDGASLDGLTKDGFLALKDVVMK